MLSTSSNNDEMKVRTGYKRGVYDGDVQVASALASERTLRSIARSGVPEVPIASNPYCFDSVRHNVQCTQGYL